MAKKKKGYQRGRTVNPRASKRRRHVPIPAGLNADGTPWVSSLPPASPGRTMGPGPSDKPGGSAAGGVVENYNDQVKRKYGGGKL